MSLPRPVVEHRTLKGSEIKIRIKNKIKRRWFQRTTNNVQLTTTIPIPLFLCCFALQKRGRGQVLTADAVADHDEEEGAKTEQERVARRFGDCRDCEGTPAPRRC